MADNRPGQGKPLSPQQQEQQAQREQAAANAKRLQAEMQAKQLVVPPAPQPPPPPAAPTRLSWAERAEAYLEEKGWDRCGVNWRGQTMWLDPQSRGGKEERVFVRMIPTQDGDVPLKQLRVPSARWEYCTEEAYGTQRERDFAVTQAAARAADARAADAANQAGQATGPMAGVA